MPREVKKTMTVHQAQFDTRVGDRIICRDGGLELPFLVKRVQRGRVSVDLGEGVCMPLPLRALELPREAQLA